MIDGWMLNWVVDNGAALVNRASQPAIDLLSRAADQVSGTDPRREIIESCLIAALRRMLRFGELQRWARVALARDGISAEHRLEMSWALAYALLYTDAPEAARVAREALASDDGGPWGARLQAIYALIVTVDRKMGDPSAAIREAHAAGQRTGDRWALGTSLQAEAMIIRTDTFSGRSSCIQRALEVLGDDPRAADLRLACCPTSILAP